MVVKRELKRLGKDFLKGLRFGLGGFPKLKTRGKIRGGKPK